VRSDWRESYAADFARLCARVLLIVMARMVRRVRDFKVLQAVIELDVVAVMNQLKRPELTPDALLYQVTR
jgi:hypothetical protein